MSKRKLRVTDLPPEAIGSVSTLDEADMIFKRIFGTRPPATRQDIAPAGWSKVRYYADKVFCIRREAI